MRLRGAKKIQQFVTEAEGIVMYKIKPDPFFSPQTPALEKQKDILHLIYNPKFKLHTYSPSMLNEVSLNLQHTLVLLNSFPLNILLQ